MKNFPVMLRTLRKQAKMTQPELAEKLGVSRSAISMYESGSREPNFAMLEAIADLFNVDMNTLTGSAPVPRPMRMCRVRRMPSYTTPPTAKKEIMQISSYHILLIIVLCRHYFAYAVYYSITLLPI